MFKNNCTNVLEEKQTSLSLSSRNQLCSLLKQVQTGNDITFAEFQALCVFISTANALLAVLAVLGNSLIITAFYRCESLRTPSNLLLLGLSFCDLFVGLVTQPVFVVETALVAANSAKACTLKDLYVIFLFVFSSASMLHVCLTSVERSFALFYPFRHQRTVTKKNVAISLGVFWIFWALLTISAGSKHGGGLIGYSRMVFVIFSALLVLLINVRLWIEARRHSRQIHNSSIPRQSISTEQNNETNSVQQATRGAKAAKTTLLIIGFMILCNLPLIATFIARKCYGVRGRVVTLLWFGSNTIVLLPAILNPVTYFWHRSDFRTCLKRMFGRQNTVDVEQ